jgi:hypothetical protein
MIPADVDVTDLEPAEWATLHELVVAARAQRRWGYVLHSGGRVLTCHPAAIPVAAGDAVPDPNLLAQSLHASCELDRIVVIDRDQLPDLARVGAELVEPGGPLTTYRERVEDLYWAHAGVATEPAPPANAWRRTREAVGQVREGVVHALVTDDGALVAGLALHIRDAAVVRISSPQAADAACAVVAFTRRQLSDALCSDDLVGRLLTAASTHPLSRNLTALRGVTYRHRSAHAS